MGIFFVEEESYRYVRKPWIGGNGTMYFGIPPKIIKKLKLENSQYLLVDVIDDIIVIKKMNQQFSKSEIKKIQANTITIDKDNSAKSIEEDDKESIKTNNENNNNPLRDVF